MDSAQQGAGPKLSDTQRYVLRDMLVAAYEAGAQAVHEHHDPDERDPFPGFGEAAHDYATHALLSAPPPEPQVQVDPANSPALPSDPELAGLVERAALQASEQATENVEELFDEIDSATHERISVIIYEAVEEVAEALRKAAALARRDAEGEAKR